MKEYFENTVRILRDSLHSIDPAVFRELIDDCEGVLRGGGRVIASGLGKNVPVCDKFVGAMVSMGLEANFMHTNSAVHGDLGMVRDKDLVILLSKSGTTTETVYLMELLKKRKCVVWLLTFADSFRGRDKCVVMDLEHEGDQWNIMPINSTVLNLIVLQTLAMELGKRMGVSLEDFKKNHPGGAIGRHLRGEE